jgi:DNA polymerase-3 subunit gamma/tau
VDDIREILDGVRYAPTSARHKIYIIDEVHMLSKNAFNALLKTLEEPPPHVKFIFATTEIRKVPVTVLSRCQRFDLRRVDASVLSDHYKRICGLENTGAEDEAIALISRAADGSVRDGLSLLDQAIALSGGNVTAQLVKDMLGLADRARVIDLLDHALKGEVPAALDVMDDLYRSGADPLVVMQDLLELVHILTRLRAVPQSKDSHAPMARDAMDRAATLAAQLSMPTLGRAWQILLKGINEVSHAPNAQTAAEMIVIRLAYAADLPDPADLIKKLKSGEFVATSSGASLSSSSRSPEPVALRSISGGGGASAALALSPQESPSPLYVGKVETLEDVAALLRTHREAVWADQVFRFVHPVKVEAGRLEFRPAPEAHPRLAQELTRLLNALTAERWIVSVSSATGGATLAELQAQAQQAALDEVKKNPLVAEILTVFPDATVKIVERKSSN